ncbi:uncharacterized protein PFLUO_LOCUS3181 [Penicillium psychrofluorescens]|uniref:uncharacterized protein n=1 Tax=Penicillium psychrofluorescens TaxID=3158075 RepID=UPI003CCD1442
MVLSLAATTTAMNCPNGWGTAADKCCPGALLADSTGKYCCVHGDNINTNIFKPRSGTPAQSTAGSGSGSGSGPGCYTKIPLTASDYSALASSASSALAVGSTNSPSTNEATPTSSGAAATTTNAAVPIAVAQEMMLGGAAVVAGLLVL